jgi:hypothetical protein
MRTLKTLLVASIVAASLYATAGTASAKSHTFQLGTAWTDDPEIVLEPETPDLPGGVSWESLPTS